MALMPDLDAALVTYLTSHTDLAPLHGGRVGTRLASGNAPAQRITSLGGAPRWPWEDTPEFQIESWGGDQAQASLLCRTTESVIYGFIGPVPGGWVRGIAVRLSRVWSPDETTGRARYLTQIATLSYPEGS